MEQLNLTEHIKQINCFANQNLIHIQTGKFDMVMQNLDKIHEHLGLAQKLIYEILWKKMHSEDAKDLIGLF